MQTETFDWLWQQMKTDIEAIENEMLTYNTCLLYTSDAADE